ncbi:MAG: hypothetical protein MUF60_00210 [Vicinamibacterales bacterium]|nr:hypothetical protein [Vicinamibacterales bacterium]
MPFADRPWGWGVALLAAVTAAGAQTLTPVHRERYAMGTMFNIVATTRRPPPRARRWTRPWPRSSGSTRC